MRDHWSFVVDHVSHPYKIPTGLEREITGHVIPHCHQRSPFTAYKFVFHYYVCRGGYVIAVCLFVSNYSANSHEIWWKGVTWEKGLDVDDNPDNITTLGLWLPLVGVGTILCDTWFVGNG